MRVRPSKRLSGHVDLSGFTTPASGSTRGSTLAARRPTNVFRQAVAGMIGTPRGRLWSVKSNVLGNALSKA